MRRVRAGMRRARLEGHRIGRRLLAVDRQAVLRDRARGLSLSQLAKLHRISRTSVARGSRHKPPSPKRKGLPWGGGLIHQQSAGMQQFILT
jgi:DNA invertase Pin-like site-specific DNA recombinase